MTEPTDTVETAWVAHWRWLHKRRSRESERLIEDAIRADERSKAQPEVDELRDLFALQNRREIEAIERWRAEDSAARDLTMPDYGRLLDWLWEKLQGEGALRAAPTTPAFWDGSKFTTVYEGESPDGRWVPYRAALDGAPYEPSAEEVEHGANMLRTKFHLMDADMYGHSVEDAVCDVLKAAYNA